MKSKNSKTQWIILFLSIGLSTNAQTNWYINPQTGANHNNGTSSNTPVKSIDYLMNNDAIEPGDTVYLMGEYTNNSYRPNYEFTGDINDPHLWHQENTLRISGLNGTPNQYITLKAYDENTVLRGDGANIFRMINCSYLRIEGLEIYGEVENIPLETALALQFLYRNNNSTNSLYRVLPGTTPEQVENMTFPILDHVKRPSYTDTRGIYLSNVHHIDLINNMIHHTPGNGFRVADCDYINIIGNEVHNCSRKSYSGTHGMVVTNANSYDDETGYKIFIQRNKVHHNFNEIYSWAPTKTMITPKIDEGKGISLQRNDLANGWSHGRILVSDNLTYWNGYSGVHSNTGTRIDFINNTAYLNSYTGTITNADQPSGNNIGISTQSNDDLKILNNIAVVDDSWGGYAISEMNSTNVEVANNLVYGIHGDLRLDPSLANIATNTIQANPLFVDTENFNFNLQANSPAIGAANPNTATLTDFLGNLRDENPDLGSLEFGAVTAVQDLDFVGQQWLAFPNPFTTELTILNKKVAAKEMAIYNLVGEDVSHLIKINNGENTSIHTSYLPKGIYFLNVQNTIQTLVKQ